MFVPLTPLEFERRAVELYGGKVGVVDGDKRFSYAQFGERVSRLANAVRNLGIKSGERVAFLSYNCHQLLEAYYGVVTAGAVLLPLNFRLSVDELAYILGHAEAQALFFECELTPLLTALLPRLPNLQRLVVLEGEPPEGVEAHQYETLLAGASAELPRIEVDENSVAELFYTSGSTGRPKGVMLTHRSLYLHAMSVMIDAKYGEDEIALHVVPLFHVNGWGGPQTITAVGGRHVMLRKFVPAEVLRLIEEEGITRLGGVPAMMSAILASPDVKSRRLSSLRYIGMGGAPTPPSLIRAMEQTFRCQVYGGYGLTETSPVVSTALPQTHLAETDEQRVQRAASAGRALIGVQLRVVAENGHDVPPDNRTSGEIVIRANQVMDGYFRDPEGTAAAIRDDWFHTGDIAVLDTEGYLTIVDRQKDVIISGGENISSVEVERVISDHPAVFECAVIAIPDDSWGEVPLAFVSLRPGASATEAELDGHCRAHLASFKAPKHWVFQDALPKGGTGKIQKNLLREPYWQGRQKRVN